MSVKNKSGSCMPQQPARRCAGPWPLSSSPFNPFPAGAEVSDGGLLGGCSALLDSLEACRKSHAQVDPFLTMFMCISISAAPQASLKLCTYREVRGQPLTANRGPVEGVSKGRTPCCRAARTFQMLRWLPPAHSPDASPAPACCPRCCSLHGATRHMPTPQHSPQSLVPCLRIMVALHPSPSSAEHPSGSWENFVVMSLLCSLQPVICLCFAVCNNWCLCSAICNKLCRSHSSFPASQGQGRVRDMPVAASRAGEPLSADQSEKC
jgi:hypothetical protein